MTNPYIDKIIKNPKHQSQKKGFITLTDSIGCLVFLIIGGFFFLAYFPGFLAYQDQKKREFALPFMETIQSSLKIYSEKQPNDLFPSEINNYDVLCQIVNNAGKSIPKIQADTKIDYFKYETTDRKSYILRIFIEDNDYHFFTVYPDGIIEVSKEVLSVDAVMELVRTTLYMDRALQEKDMTEYFKYYSPDAYLRITHTTYQGHRPPLNRNELESIIHADLDLYSDSLMKFYRSTSVKFRKRERMSIRRNGQLWEVSSDYSEEGTKKGKKYLKDGGSRYSIALSESSNHIVNDRSNASIYLLEN
jgi:hypothetical protein